MTSMAAGQHRVAEVSFGARLGAAMQSHGRLCVGLDPHPQILSDWGLTQDAAGLREFCARVLAACTERVGVIKPQVAFFERFGVAGLQVLSEVQAQARESGLLVIADAKRGDVGSTMAGYAEAWLNPAGDFAADALTVSPYLGFGSLQPALDAAQEHRAGLFVLALTSNPEGREVQLATDPQGVTVAGRVATAAAAANVSAAAAANVSAATATATQDHPVDAAEDLGSIGLVVGATTAELAGAHGIDLSTGSMPLLAPGYGAQGASAEDLRRGFGACYSRQVLVNSSRGILAAGPRMESLTSAIDQALEDLS
ncbi:orotidine-5'-phosphate decarboxylase [Nesterenkonia sp. Act20]|uniref:orotidine-5'-phosphate decarboxylase n=1 Tax=Nesterenkonia sp. Act20 TaxID=1483432 RepID=UPI001C44D1DE|nr:orotidine-5'-phosphate decarboxylase [Nesterenkonia sp. Act20]